MHLLFVYGTLKKGCKNHRHLAGQRFDGEAATAAGYRLHDLGEYPGMVFDPGTPGHVRGELWSVDDDALARLDAFEGVGEGLYRRAPVGLAAPHDGTTAWTYLYLRDVSRAPAIGPAWTE